MNTKELSKQVRDKVVEKYRSGLGYKKISENLNIPLSTTTLPREGRPPKLTDQSRRALIREATKRPKITLKKLQAPQRRLEYLSIGPLQAVHSTELGFTEECP